ncbi:hypothetical protein Taro_042656 [Colocasia esculenta]|uniref:Uncharacterized protein n=1 Tax=Colocasia esculenta TaxID=4460 RepID=A0A843WTF5_COLES|nr:hypothetical protein [Colocasia esculenta]
MSLGVRTKGLVQAMQTQAHTQAALQAQLEAQERADVWWASLLRTRFEDSAIDVAWDEFPSLRTTLVVFDHHTLDEALSAACRQEGEMEQYLEKKKASQKRPAAPFQWQDKKKAVYQSPQHPVAASNTQVPSQRSPSVKKECPHCGRTHGDFNRESSVERQPQQWQQQQHQLQEDQEGLEPKLECLL